jgi:hypothetical protein
MNTQKDEWLTTQEATALPGNNPNQIKGLARNCKIKT